MKRRTKAAATQQQQQQETPPKKEEEEKEETKPFGGVAQKVRPDALRKFFVAAVALIVLPLGAVFGVYAALTGGQRWLAAVPLADPAVCAGIAGVVVAVLVQAAFVVSALRER